MNSLAGKFIVFDGPDGCGKTTQRGLAAEAIRSAGLNVVQCRDPGGTAIGDNIRKILLEGDLSLMDVRCETFLFMASRSQLVGEIIEPAIGRGDVVLCDRFISSTCAYQGAAGYDMKRIVEVGYYAVSNTWPDLTLILEVDVEEGFDRTGRKAHHVGRHRRRQSGQGTMFEDSVPDAMEARPIEFHRKVRSNFLGLAAVYPRPVVVVDGRGTPDEVHQRVMRAIQHALG